jgi:hypothetical protein
MSPATAAARARAPVAGLPYKLLDYYKEGEAATFAGREDDVTEVVARAARERTFVLYGRSGLGKTSLILAGVFPQLRKRGFRPVHVRVLDDPLVDLRNAIATDLQLPSAENADDLDALLRAASCRDTAPAGVVLVLDQFEEFFIRQRKLPVVRRAFINRISELVLDPQGTVQVFFSLREDYLAEMDDFRVGLPEVLANAYRLRPLTAFGARQAIIAPLGQSGIGYDQRLVVRLVDLLAEFDFDSLLLQIACSEVYREAVNRHGETHLTEADLDQVGGLDGLFRRYLDNAIKRVPDGQLLLARAVLDALITQEQTKRAITIETLKQNEEFCASDLELDSVLGCLEQQRLLRREMRAGKLWYELSHERLVPRILEWFKRDTDFANFRDARDVITTATRQVGFRQKLETLLHEGQIRELITPYRKRLNLNPLAREFMFWSAVYRRIDDVDYWADRFGYEQCAGVLLTLLASPNAEARLGAARAAGLLAGKLDPKVENQNQNQHQQIEELRTALTRAALDDAKEDVRRAAGRSLAVMATSPEINAVKQALRSRKTRHRALAVLADFGECGGPLGQFRFYWRRWAQRRMRMRAFDQYREAIRKRGARGAIVGLATGFVWALTIGALLLCVSVWLPGFVRWVPEVISMLTWVSFGATLTGLLFGWRFARVAARQAAAQGVEGRWFSVATRFWPPGVAAATAVVVVLLGVTYGEFGLALGAYAIGLWLAPVIAGGFVRLARPAIWPNAGTTSVAIWSWLLGFATLSFIGLFLTAGLVSLGWSEETLREAMTLNGILGLVVSLLITVTMLTLVETSTYYPAGAIPELLPRKRLLWRGAILAVTIGTVPLYFAVFGIGSVPMLASHHTVPADEAETFDIPFSGWHPRATFIKIRSANAAGQWYRAPGEAIGGTVATRGNLALDNGHIIFLTGSYELLAAAHRKQTPSVKLKLEPVPEFQADQTVDLSDKERTVFLLKLSRQPQEDRSDNTAQWSGTLRGRLSTGATRMPMTVIVSFPGHSTSGRDGKMHLLSTEPKAETSPVFSYVVPDSFEQFAPTDPGKLRLEPLHVWVDAQGQFEFTVTFKSSADYKADITIPVGLNLHAGPPDPAEYR